jgi:hypothetical protein
MLRQVVRIVTAGFYMFNTVVIKDCKREVFEEIIFLEEVV